MARLSLTELRRRFVDEGRPLPRDLEGRLERDPRRGAQAILAAVARRRRRSRAEGQRLRHLLRYERPLWERGVTYVAGVDEAGMSPLAGPVCAAAVVLPPKWRHPGIDDSKRLAPEVRESLGGVIRAEAVAWAVGFAEPEEIDRLNVYHAGLLAMRRAVLGLPTGPQHLLVDARTLALDLPQEAIIKGDQKSLSIAAASIVAKTTRDALMVELDARYPGYGLARHKGYGVPEHVDALRRLGPTPLHRRSFPRVRRILREA